MVRYLVDKLESFVEIWGTIVWLFVGGHFILHFFVSWYAWRVVNQDKARVHWLWPILASFASIVTAFITVGIIALPIAGMFISINFPLPTWVAFIIAGALLLVYILLNFNGLFIF
jgi:hypothetical protein